MALSVGFNGQIVSDMLDKIDEEYSKFYQYSKTDVTQNFINPMGENWVCKEAVDFFQNKFAPSMDSIYKDSYMAFYDIFDKVNFAGSAWASETGNANIYSAKQFIQDQAVSDVSAIKEDINGQHGINIEETQQGIENLKICFENSKDCLETVINCVSENAFLGGEQTENLVRKLREIKTKLSKSIEELEVLINQSIIETILEYKGLTNSVENSFEIDAKSIDFSRITTNAAAACGGEFMAEENIHKQWWGDNASGKMTYKIRDDGSILISEDGVAMGYTDQQGLINALSGGTKDFGWSDNRSQVPPTTTQATSTPTQATQNPTPPAQEVPFTYKGPGGLDFPVKW